MNRLTATMKGLITGILMIGVSLLIYQAEKNFENNYQYVTYALYIGGVVWTLTAYHRSATEKRKFSNYFSEGFKCFVVVTLLMVIFTFTFLRMHPEIKDQMANAYRKDLSSKGNTTPAEIDSLVLKAREGFTTVLTSMAVFGYLIIGSLITAITAAFFIQKNSYAKK